MRRTLISRVFIKARRVHEPPLNGYEVAELPNERIFEEYMRRYGSKQLVVTVLHSGNIPVTINSAAPTFAHPSTTNPDPKKKLTTSSVLHPANQKAPIKDVFDPVARSLLSGFNMVNLGHPDEVKVVTLPGNNCPTIASAYHVLAYPTTLLFYKNKYIDRVVGCRFDEIATKCLFTLRNNGGEVFSEKAYIPQGASAEEAAARKGVKK